jgi:hypothetical protein
MWPVKQRMFGRGWLCCHSQCHHGHRGSRTEFNHTISSRFIITSALPLLQLKHNEYVYYTKKQSANAPGTRFNCSQGNEYNSRERVQTAGTDMKLQQTRERKARIRTACLACSYSSLITVAQERKFICARTKHRK